MNEPEVDDELTWQSLRDQWSIAEGLTYLNHGSFGLQPRQVIEARNETYNELAGNPMAIFDRTIEQRMTAVRDRMSDFVGSGRDHLVLVENATYAMNVVAGSFPLGAGDEVLLTDHEYGAVNRIWQRACRRAGAKVVEAALPLPVESEDQVVDAIMAAVTDRTRLLVFSHITSGSAIILPAEKICAAARVRGVRVCVDGPHAVATLLLELKSLGCDYYTASCHKWLCGPFGTGFLYVHPDAPPVEPVLVSWGRVLPNLPETWQDWFTWTGTRDASSMLSLPAAMDFMESIGYESFRRRAHYLARQARERLLQIRGVEPIVPDSESWYGPMTTLRVPYHDAYQLRSRMHEEYGIELLTVPWKGARYLRVSCHLYNNIDDIERLGRALEALCD